MTASLRTAAAAILGFLAGVLLVLAGLSAWPFAHLDRSDRVMQGLEREPLVEVWSFDTLLDAPGSMLAVSHSGSLPLVPFPAGIPRMTEPPIASGLAMLTVLRDSSGEVVGVASELESGHEDSNLLRGRLMTHTTWTAVIPGRGAFVAYQTEDNWTLAKRIAGPAMLSGQPWHGRWFTVNTLGPRPDGRGRVLGLTGEFAGCDGSFVETAVLRGFHPRGAMDFTMDLRLVRDCPAG